MEDILNKMLECCENITGFLPNSLDSLKSELKSFIKQKGGGDFIIDDLRSLFEIAVIYSDKSEIIDENFYDYLEMFINNHDLKKDIKVNDENVIIENIANEIISIHSDLYFKINNGGIDFYNDKGDIFSFYNIFTLKHVNELVGNIKLHKINNLNTLYPLLSNKLILKKRWVSKNKKLVGENLTVNELKELIINRKIINYEIA